MKRLASATLASAALAVVLGACGGDDPDADQPEPPIINDERCLDAREAERPQVDWLWRAIEASDAHYGSEQRYFEISVDRQRVSLIVATQAGDAEQSFYCGPDGYGQPESLGPADGATFGRGDLDLSTETVLSGIEDELGNSMIIDFVIQGAPDGVVYDATVQSDAGGILLVLLSPVGEVLAVQTS